jgi:signal transduction histidine kinase
LRRVVANLVENAIRHAPADSVVRVESTRAEEGVLLRVADEGSGVPKELAAHIFDPFVQAQAAPGQALTRTGRGLGLAFCRVAVEAHGGRIWVEDGSSKTRGPGALFCVWLKEP